MKKISLLFIMLFATFPGYGDKWDDICQDDLNQIQESLSISPKTGYQEADRYALKWNYYVLGFVHGSMASENSQERESKRFADWAKVNRELSDKRRHFIYARDYGNASYYAKKEFELNCEYAATWRRENLQ